MKIKMAEVAVQDAKYDNTEMELEDALDRAGKN